MLIVGLEKLDDCFDDSGLYEARFDRAWTEAAIRALADLGKVEYFPEFPRPFFRVRRSDGFEMKGVAGAETCRVAFPRKDVEREQERFWDRFGRARA